ncbi:MAG TPA: phospho-N-acetylmuramoyl-pentapeptide-transferase [Nitrospiria bacterium]|nr:phospho-N-acetylmuramoyl-pentapeptide-transferase [Nitrospiria bacterium]
MFYLLYFLHANNPFFNVLRYITFRTSYAVLTAFVICIAIGPWVIRQLQQSQIGQQIRSDGPKTHLSKAGTPTMGGLIILVAVLGATWLWADLESPYVWLTVLSLALFGLIGFVDDYLKFVKKHSAGLWPRYKLAAQTAVAAGIVGILYGGLNYSTQLSLPFFKNIHPDLGWAYLPFAVLVIVGASNAVNLTDGLDGLATGPVAVAAVAYTIVTYITGHRIFADYLLIPYLEGAGELAVVCGALFGACLGFLWFNSHPASVFMGDVGSLPLGGMLGTVAVITKHEFLLLFVGGLFVIEALSVILQVASFKLRAKRIFLMAPLHHHFELKGWSESKVVVRFWIIAIVMALLSLSTLKLR